MHEHASSIRGLRAGVAGKEILRGVDLEVASGQVHAVMGPNGSGKSHAGPRHHGRPGLRGLRGQRDPRRRRAARPAHLEAGPGRPVPGHAVPDRGARRVARPTPWPPRSPPRAERPPTSPSWWPPRPMRIGFEHGACSPGRSTSTSPAARRSATRPCSWRCWRPKFAVLDEIDSGLDVDALKAVSQRVELITNEVGLGVLVITHYSRLLARAAARRGVGAAQRPDRGLGRPRAGRGARVHRLRRLRRDRRGARGKASARSAAEVCERGSPSRSRDGRGGPSAG